MDFIEITLILESIRNRGQNIYLISKGIKEQKKKGSHKLEEITCRPML